MVDIAVQKEQKAELKEQMPEQKVEMQPLDENDLLDIFE